MAFPPPHFALLAPVTRLFPSHADLAPPTNPAPHRCPPASPFPPGSPHPPVVLPMLEVVASNNEPTQPKSQAALVPPLSYTAVCSAENLFIALHVNLKTQKEHTGPNPALASPNGVERTPRCSHPHGTAIKWACQLFVCSVIKITGNQGCRQIKYKGPVQHHHTHRFIKSINLSEKEQSLSSPLTWHIYK